MTNLTPYEQSYVDRTGFGQKKKRGSDYIIVNKKP